MTETGGLRCVVSRTSYDLKPGTVLVLHPDQPHQGEAGFGWSYRAFYPEAQAMSSLVDEVTGRRSDVPDFPTVIEDAALAERLLWAHRNIERGEAESRQTAYLAALSTLATCARQFEIRQVPMYIPQGGVALVKDFIHSRYSEPITITQLATAAGCGVFQLMRAFERQVGVPVHTYVTQVRLKHACALLADGEPSAEVAAAVGFADQSHLIRRFRQAYGVTPGSFVRDSR